MSFFGEHVLIDAAVEAAKVQPHIGALGGLKSAAAALILFARTSEKRRRHGLGLLASESLLFRLGPLERAAGRCSRS